MCRLVVATSCARTFKMREQSSYEHFLAFGLPLSQRQFVDAAVSDSLLRQVDT